MTIHLALLIAYCVVIMGMGLYVGRRTKTKGDFFVAGRSLGPGLLFATLVAANIGAGSTVGASGLGYRDGLSAWWWVGSAALGSLVQAFLVGPRMRRVAAERGLHTVGDFLEYRYGRNVRGIVSSLLWVGTLAILAGQIIAMGLVLNAVLGLPRYVGCLLGGIVMTVYFTAGGLLTSAWVNALQLVLELSVYALLVPVALSRAGGWAALAAAAPPNPEYWSFWRGGASGVTYLALLGPAFIISPGLLQKVYGARDDRTVRIGVAANAALLFLFAFVPVILGMVARVLHPELPNHELALPTVDIALPGPLPRVLQAGRQRRRGAARGTDGGGDGRDAGCAAGRGVPQRDRRAEHLLYAPRRVPVRAHDGRPVRAPRGHARSIGRHRRRRGRDARCAPGHRRPGVRDRLARPGRARRFRGRRRRRPGSAAAAGGAMIPAAER